MLKSLALLAAGVAAVALPTPPHPAPAAQDVSAVLERQTQEMADAIAAGDVKVWDRYLHPNLRLTDESGTVSTKAEMLAQTKPLPAGVSGSIKVTDFKATVTGSIAVATYVDDENEDYHGHKLHCRYRSTDTWVQTPEGWRLLASQVLALRGDPPTVKLTAQQRAEYVGRYALAPEITYEIREKDGGLLGQRSGGKVEMLQAEAPDVLFVPGNVRYRTIILRGADGKVNGFAERREAWDIDWKRLP
jgi:Domain of unknown function (DUF4440)